MPAALRQRQRPQRAPRKLQGTLPHAASRRARPQQLRMQTRKVRDPATQPARPACWHPSKAALAPLMRQSGPRVPSKTALAPHVRKPESWIHAPSAAEEVQDPTAGMSARERKLWELQQQLRVSRKQNADAVVAERRRAAKPEGAAVRFGVCAAPCTWRRGCCGCCCRHRWCGRLSSRRSSSSSPLWRPCTQHMAGRRPALPVQ